MGVLKLVECVSTYREGSFVTYAWHCIKNAMITARAPSGEQLLDTGTEVEDWSTVMDFIDSLTARQAAIVRLRLEGYTRLEVAEKLGVNRNTVLADLKKVGEKWIGSR